MWAIKQIIKRILGIRPDFTGTVDIMKTDKSSRMRKKGEGVGLSKSEKRGVYVDQKCHHWSGDLLVKKKYCRHKFRRGIVAKTLIVGEPVIISIKFHSLRQGRKRANL